MDDEIVNVPETPEVAPPPVEPGVAPPGSIRSQEDWEKRMAEKDRTSWEHEKAAKSTGERADALQAEIDGLKADPYRAYIAMGGTEEHLKERFAGGGAQGASEVQTAQDKRIEALETLLAERGQKDKDAEYQKSLGGFAGQVKESFDSENEFAALYVELQDAMGMGDDFNKIVETQIGRYKDATGKQLTPSDAAVMIADDFKAHAEEQRGNPRIRAAMAKLYNLTMPDEEPPAPGDTPEPKTGDTLTSDMGKSAAPAADGSNLKLGSPEHLEFLKRKHIKK